MIIVNSDDFGFYKPYNRSAYLAYKEGLISSLSCFTNYEEGLKDALQYVKQGKIDVNVIGLHANWSSGLPLTKLMRTNNRFCLNGKFRNDASIRLFYLDKKSRKHVYDELVAQIEKFIETFGKIPSHIDSHHHLHTHWGVLPIFLSVAKAYRIPVVRIARNTGADSSFKRFYKKLVNKKIRSSGFYTVDYFGEINDYLKSGTSHEKNSEIMVHAITDENGNLIDVDGEDLRIKITKILQPNDSINSFADLAGAN